MEAVVIVIMLTVALTFLLKLSCHGRAGTLATCVVASLFTALCGDLAAMQSKTQIADWLRNPDLMLDTSVLLTLDVMMQLAFCFLRTRKAAGERLSRWLETVFRISFWLPGLMIFPVLFSALVEVIFAVPGADFRTVAWAAGAAVLVAGPALAWALRRLMPRLGTRLELLFLNNLLSTALGVVATVNGRTASAGVSEVEWSALAAVLGLVAAGAVTGLIIVKIKTLR